MDLFTIHTKETAPEESKELLAGSEKGAGFIPNMHGIMAGSPALLKAYKEIGKIFGETSFDRIEREIIEMTINQINGCSYCVAAHSYFDRLSKFPQDILTALVENEPLDDSKLQTLRLFTKAVVEKKGWVSPQEIDTFFSAGYTQENVMEILVGIGHKTMSNYLNHLANTPIDEIFSK